MVLLGDKAQMEPRFGPFGVVLVSVQDRCTVCTKCSIASDEDINPDMGMATPTEPAQAPPGPLTRARARELNFVMILKNEGPEVS
jgi:hypothetical protein